MFDIELEEEKVIIKINTSIIIGIRNLLTEVILYCSIVAIVYVISDNSIYDVEMTTKGSGTDLISTAAIPLYFSLP